MVRRATCCCGACFIEVEGEPVLNGVCHCDNCRQRTGSAFGWSIYFPDQQVVQRDGKFGEYVIDNVVTQTRYFCSACGTTLYWKRSTRPTQIGIAGGCFTRADAPLPSITVCDDNRSEWVALPREWRVSSGTIPPGLVHKA
ncbi:MAG: GFA family protein [Acetobacteraceae bacterium]|jgi:hypothetical protein